MSLLPLTQSAQTLLQLIDDGSTSAQVFVGRNSLVTDACGMKNDKQFVNTLQDNIRKRGAMDKLIGDSAQVETSHRTKDIFWALMIDDWQSEPRMQHQNFAEREALCHYQACSQLAVEQVWSPCIHLAIGTGACVLLLEPPRS